MLTEGDVLQIGALEPNILEAVLTYPDHRLFAILLTILGWEILGPYLDGN